MHRLHPRPRRRPRRRRLPLLIEDNPRYNFFRAAVQLVEVEVKMHNTMEDRPALMDAGGKKMGNKDNGGGEAECDRNEDVSLEVSGATKMNTNTKCVYFENQGDGMRYVEIHGGNK